MIGYLRARLLSPVGVILIGSLVGQGSILIASPLLTRLYSPSDFGALATVTATSAIGAAIVTLTWDRAVAIPKHEREAAALAILGVGSTLAVTTLFAILSFCAAETGALTGVNPHLRDFWWIIPATIGSIGLFNVFSSWLIREQSYRALGERNAIQGLAQTLSTIGLGIGGVGTLGLTSGLLIGRAAGLAGMSKRTSTVLRHRLSFKEVRRTAVRFRKFPAVATWSRLLNSLGLQLPILLLITLFGSAEAGLFALTVRVLASPVGIVTDAVSQYFEGALASTHRASAPRRNRLVMSVVKRLFVIGLVPTALIAVFGGQAFAVIFGEEWSRSGVIAQVAVIGYFLQFCVSPVSRTLLVLEHQSRLLIWDVTRAALSVLAIIVPFGFGSSILLAIAALTCVQVLTYLLLFAMCARAASEADAQTTSTGG